MRKLFRVFCAFFLALVIASSCCGKGDDRRVRPSTQVPEFAPVAVWLDGHPALRSVDAESGCAFWCFKGVSCTAVADRSAASVLVIADVSACAKGPDGTFHLGDAHFDGATGVVTVNLRVECFRNGFPRSMTEPYDRFKLRSVLAHELGHAFGIWEHVPDDCKQAHKTHDGLAVCGDALMNALWEPSTPCPTAIDGIAFDARDTKLSVLRPGGTAPAGMTPRCTCGPDPP